MLDIRAPNNNQTPVITGPSSLFDQASKEKIESFYVKWVARPSDRLRLIAAGRWDRYQQAFNYTYADGLGYSEAGASSLGDNLFSYRVAASFDVTHGITTFLGYSNGYMWNDVTPAAVASLCARVIGTWNGIGLSAPASPRFTA